MHKNLSAPLLARRRHVRRSAHTGWRRLSVTIALLISLSLVCSGLLLSAAFASLSYDLPPLQALPALLSPPAGLLLQPSQFFDRSGEHLLLTLENPAAAGKQYLPVSQENQPHIDPDLINAVIAFSDPDFWQHPGFNLRSLAGEQPLSIAERLVDVHLLNSEPDGARKTWRRRLLAAQITAHYGREQVLEWYLNSASFGRLTFGVDAAARVYFGAAGSSLSLAQAAMLAGVLESPAFNPFDAPQAAKEKQLAVLESMQSAGFVSAEESHRATGAILSLQAPAAYAQTSASTFVELALEQAYAELGRERIERGGLRIYTSLDYDLQTQVTCAAQVQAQRLVSGESLFSADSDEPCPAAQLLPTLPAGETYASSSLGLNALLLDPSRGEILALAAHQPFGLDSALNPGRPAGTLLTPFIYLTGFTRGFSPSSLVWDIPEAPGGSAEETPNLDGEYNGPMRLRTALANDELPPAVRLLSQVGSENVFRIMRQIGLSSLDVGDRADPTGVFWQEGQISLLEITQAYATLANEGIQAGQNTADGEVGSPQASLHAAALRYIEDLAGKVWLDWRTPQLRPVISPQLAYLINHTLSDETARWRSLGHPNPLEIGRPSSAKLGQTRNGQDAWAVGYTPKILAGVWVGVKEGQHSRLSSSAASALWHALMQYASREQPAVGWQAPAGITTLEVCDPSGMLPTPYCPFVTSEIFASGTEPTQLDNLYRPISINRQSGRLATVATPPELIEDRVYLIVPAEAQTWAETAGIDQPPEDYDIFGTVANLNENVQISTPAQFAYLQGKVSVRGTAAGEQFDFYRLQFGQGLNPTGWIQIGSDQSRAVRSGILGEWDSTGLSGLYALQLIVVRSDQRLETHTIQVTVDNQPPSLSLLFPAEDQPVTAASGELVSFQALASDNLQVQEVSFSLDGRLLARLSQAPYIYPWRASRGAHTLEVRAVDLAGNSQSLKLSFEIE